MKKLITLAAITVSFLVSCKQEVYYSIATKVQPDGAGSIVASPSSGQVQEGASVTFTAKPNGEFAFTGWSGSFSGTENPKTVTASSNLNVIANFTLRSYPLTITVEGEGSVTEKVISTKADYTSGTTIELTAQAAEHWLFERWEGDLNGNTNPAQITVTSSMSIKAVFVKKMYDLTVTVEGEGAVGEKVVETKSGSYQEGTIVELTATPSTGWSFGHWEGDMSGTDNPATITISSAKTVKAVFTKNKYAYNLTIVGPGVVDEYLVETKSSFEHGTKILLKAIPSEGAVFKGWSGAYSGTEEEITVSIDEAKDLVATFEKEVFIYPLPDLMQPSVKLKYLCPGQDFKRFSFHACGIHLFDYNRDGYMDVLVYDDDWSEDAIHNPIRFYLGSSDGYFIKDSQNYGSVLGNNPRKTITGDYNGDGLPDFFLASHGYDAPPFPGDFPVVLLSQMDGSYREVEYVDYVSFYHGGASADYDNDGDLDVVLVDGGYGKEIVLVNDGYGGFTAHHELVNHDLLKGFYTAELIDIDKDGYIDLLAGLNDVDGTSVVPFENDYNNMSVVFWGNGADYNGSYTRLPKTGHKGMGLVLDYDFFDVDGDGNDEIILARTGDPVFGKNYEGWAIQVVKCEGRSFIDITDSVIRFEDSCDANDHSISWINFEEYKGKTYLVGRKQVNAELLFEFSDGKLLKVEKAEVTVLHPKNGFFLESQEITYSGWKKWDGNFFVFNDSLENGADLSYLKDNDFALEFFIRNENPSLTIDIKFESFIDHDAWKLATYFYGYIADEHPTDGKWERVVVPLKNLDDWTDHSTNYWSLMDHVHFQISSDGGQPFSLKDIRIRKVLPD